MSSQLFICPKCGCPDLLGEKQDSTIITSLKDRKVSCPNCKWEGTLNQAGGIFTKEKAYDLKQVMNLLLHVTAKHASGPISQALEFIGLLDKDDVEGRNVVMRAALEGTIREAFAAAAEHAAKSGKTFDFADTNIAQQSEDKVS